MWYVEWIRVYYLRLMIRKFILLKGFIYGFEIDVRFKIKV